MRVGEREARILNEIIQDNNRDPTIRRHQIMIKPTTPAPTKKPTNKLSAMTVTAANANASQPSAAASLAAGKVKQGFSSGVNMGTSANISKKVVGRPATGTALATTTGHPATGPTKKAHVRFDDYLDLNEENMRRSCKRLMNHLYSESSSPPSSATAADAIANNGAIGVAATSRKLQANEAPKNNKQLSATGALPIKSSMANNSSNSKGDIADISIGSKSAPAAVQQKQPKQNSPIATSLPTATTTNGKSYLRSQYERRQQRQLELMSKMQLEPGNNNNNNNADGANECRRQQQQQENKQKKHQKHQQQQQDLVAKSHELSKRRFFEKLERRESIRNLNLSTPPPPPPPLPLSSLNRLKTAAPDAKKCSLGKTLPKTIEQAVNKFCEHGQQRQLPTPSTDNRQNGIGDGELMLKVYQSIVLKGTNSTATTNTTILSDYNDGFNNDTLGGLDGTQPSSGEPTSAATKELSYEPIGLHIQSPQFQSSGVGQQQKQCPQPELLIEFSSKRQEPQLEQKQNEQQDAEQLIQLDENSGMSSSGSCCFELLAQSTTTTEVANHSAFEIKVPETLNSSQNPLDGFISSGLLIVKQVDKVTSVDSNLLSVKQAKLSAPSTTLAGGPPTLSGRHHCKDQEEAEGDESTRLVANKIKMPLEVDDELADNKMKQIGGHGTDRAMIEMMNRSIIVGGASTNLVSSSNLSSIATMAALCTDDQHQGRQALASGSITISSENNNNNNNNNNELMNRAIRPPIVVLETTTTSNGVGNGGKFDREEEFKALPSEHSNYERKTAGVSEVSSARVGESKDHEAPEMRMFVGQSGGASKNGDLAATTAADGPDDDGKKSASCFIQTQSTAQKVQQVASLQTTITTKQPEIRDVLPIANEINRIEAIMSVKEGSARSCLKQEALVVEKATLVESARQVNEVYGSVRQQGCSIQMRRESHGIYSDGYANSTLYADDKERKNNVNHDVRSEVGLDASIQLSSALGEHNDHLIESFSDKTRHHSALTQKHSNSLSVEEDGGSSCSSSGFGASVSVTSSSDGSNSLTDTLLVVSGPSSKTSRESGAIRRPNSLVVQVPSHRNNDPIYDSVRPRAWSGRNQQHLQQPSSIVPGSENTSTNADAFPDRKQLVGPDQAYPLESGRLLLVENHNYASILNRCDMRDRNGIEASIVLERDDSVEGYANLPMIRNQNSEQANNKVPANVEYATVRPPTNFNNGNSFSKGNSMNSNMNSCQGKTKRLSDSSACSEANSSGHSYSSENSGGFSALPPARLELCPASNNVESTSVDLNTDSCSSPKKSSLLKRFGTLVSRAFTSANQQTSTTSTNIPQSQAILIKTNSASKIDEISSNPLANSDSQVGSSRSSNCNGIERKSASLVIEQNHHHRQHKQLTASKSKQQEIEEADLVILPSKHVDHLQKQQPFDEQHEKRVLNGPARNRWSHDGNRFSLTNHRLSRKLKKLKSTSVASLSTPASSSESPSPSSLSASSTNIRLEPNEYPKRSESLFEDLECLVSVSEQSDAYGRAGSLRRSRRRATVRQPRATIEGRIEIDCISPDKLKKKSKGASINDTKATGGPRSFLRIFNASSQRSPSESTPNLAAPVQDSCSDYASNCVPICGEQEAADRSSMQPISGFWGFSSLMMGSSHARADTTGDLSSKTGRNQARTKKDSSKLHKGERQKESTNMEYRADSSMVYSNLQPPSVAEEEYNSLHPSSRHQENHLLEKYQSLNLYQNLLRNYAKRRNSNRHGYHHHYHHSHNHSNHYGSGHNHHHHSHYHHSRSNRHSYRSTRCNAQNCQLSSSSSEISTNQGRAVVWGQLIKINKADGSQVIELQRLPGKSWGFFVARGAINDIKGIFISRMHDSVTSNSLTGLLSIGDRILAIDECPIELDYDILRVNQMMSKKSKILLKVKPFKG